MASVALAVVAGGSVYNEYAERLFASAQEFFWPLPDRQFFLIPGDEGWPDGTMRRPYHLLHNLPRADYIYLCDADMLFEQRCGPEVLPQGNGELVATQHPGYFRQPPGLLPFEDRPESACYVPPNDRGTYYCGGFGGSRIYVQHMAGAIVQRIVRDADRGITPVWHDESALNAVLSDWGGPDVALTPAYCHPDRDEHYVANIWGEQLPRILVALDKPAGERTGREPIPTP